MASRITLTLLLPICVFAGCDQSGGVRQIETVRSVATSEESTPSNLSHAERFGMRMSAPETSPELRLAWDTPEGWKELPPTEFRLANLLVAGNPDAECSVTKLSGAGGGMAANLNRWRGQMSLPSYTAEEIAALPTREILGVQATYVQMEGAYGGMSGDEGGGDYKLVGAIIETAESAIFIKMTGPVDLINAELPKFELFCDSLRIDGGQHDHAHDHDHEADAHVHDDAPSIDTAALTWTAPDTWQKAPDRSMRLVTYTVGEAECYVTVLSGAAGGVEANINRWRNQMEQASLDPAQIAELPTLDVLGVPSPMVEVSGTFTDMSGITSASQALLGVVRPSPTQTLFIKMTGPEAAVVAERENFRAFCESIK